LVDELSVDRKLVQGSKRGVICPPVMEAERLDGKQNFIYANENSNSKHCAVLNDV
jgi:hypothetical protein